MRWAAMEVCSRLKMTLLLGSHMSVVEGGLKWVEGNCSRGMVGILRGGACVAASVAFAGMPHRQNWQT
jgi:hypothetical protein